MKKIIAIGSLLITPYVAFADLPNTLLMTMELIRNGMIAISVMISASLLFNIFNFYRTDNKNKMRGPLKRKIIVTVVILLISLLVIFFFEHFYNLINYGHFTADIFNSGLLEEVVF